VETEPSVSSNFCVVYTHQTYMHALLQLNGSCFPLALSWF